jgi:2-polyprenyl-3-methyl-5-hydroxy-6-metoxy-1,4-benzoquinol methylase
MTSPCPICGSSVTPTIHLLPLPFSTCRACGFTFRDDRSGDQVRARYEEGEYVKVRAVAYVDPATVPDRRRDARVRLDFLAPFTTSGRLVDVGTAGGLFVAEAGARGFEAEGLEPTPEFAAFARDEIGVRVRTTTVEDADIPNGSMDVATMWHVLEHVPDPVTVLRQLRDTLRPGGVLAVEVPNAASYLARALARRWPALEPAVHVNQFGPRSLATALERAGLAVAHAETVTYRPYMSDAQRASIGTRMRRAVDAVVLRSTADPHPSGHELLRAVAHRPK